MTILCIKVERHSSCYKKKTFEQKSKLYSYFIRRRTLSLLVNLKSMAFLPDNGVLSVIWVITH